MSTVVRFSKLNAKGKATKVYTQEGKDHDATVRLYRYAVRVATDDSFLIELVVGNEIRQSHRVTFDPMVQEPVTLRNRAA
jgi:hypothetical protein